MEVKRSMNIKEVILAMLVLVVATTIGVLFAFAIRGLLRIIAKKFNIITLKNEEKLNTIENIISIVVLGLVLLLAKPFVISILESLVQ